MNEFFQIIAERLKRIFKFQSIPPQEVPEFQDIQHALRETAPYPRLLVPILNDLCANPRAIAELVEGEETMSIFIAYIKETIKNHVGEITQKDIETEERIDRYISNILPSIILFELKRHLMIKPNASAEELISCIAALKDTFGLDKEISAYLNGHLTPATFWDLPHSFAIIDKLYPGAIAKIPIMKIRDMMASSSLAIEQCLNHPVTRARILPAHLAICYIHNRESFMQLILPDKEMFFLFLLHLRETPNLSIDTELLSGVESWILNPNTTLSEHIADEDEFLLSLLHTKPQVLSQILLSDEHCQQISDVALKTLITQLSIESVRGFFNTDIHLYIKAFILKDRNLCQSLALDLTTHVVPFLRKCSTDEVMALLHCDHIKGALLENKAALLHLIYFASDETLHEILNDEALLLEIISEVGIVDLVKNDLSRANWMLANPSVIEQIDSDFIALIRHSGSFYDGFFRAINIKNYAILKSKLDTELFAELASIEGLADRFTVLEAQLEALEWAKLALQSPGNIPHLALSFLTKENCIHLLAVIDGESLASLLSKPEFADIFYDSLTIQEIMKYANKECGRKLAINEAFISRWTPDDFSKFRSEYMHAMVGKENIIGFLEALSNVNKPFYAKLWEPAGTDKTLTLMLGRLEQATQESPEVIERLFNVASGLILPSNILSLLNLIADNPEPHRQTISNFLCNPSAIALCINANNIHKVFEFIAVPRFPEEDAGRIMATILAEPATCDDSLTVNNLADVVNVLPAGLFRQLMDYQPFTRWFNPDVVAKVMANENHTNIVCLLGFIQLHHMMPPKNPNTRINFINNILNRNDQGDFINALPLNDFFKLATLMQAHDKVTPGSKCLARLFSQLDSSSLNDTISLSKRQHKEDLVRLTKLFFSCRPDDDSVLDFINGLSQELVQKINSHILFQNVTKENIADYIDGLEDSMAVLLLLNAKSQFIDESNIADVIDAAFERATTMQQLLEIGMSAKLLDQVLKSPEYLEDIIETLNFKTLLNIIIKQKPSLSLESLTRLSDKIDSPEGAALFIKCLKKVNPEDLASFLNNSKCLDKLLAQDGTKALFKLINKRKPTLNIEIMTKILLSRPDALDRKILAKRLLSCPISMVAELASTDTASAMILQEPREFFQYLAIQTNPMTAVNYSVKIFHELVSKTRIVMPEPKEALLFLDHYKDCPGLIDYYICKKVTTRSEGLSQHCQAFLSKALFNMADKPEMIASILSKHAKLRAVLLFEENVKLIDLCPAEALKRTFENLVTRQHTSAIRDFITGLDKGRLVALLQDETVGASFKNAILSHMHLATACCLKLGQQQWNELFTEHERINATKSYVNMHKALLASPTGEKTGKHRAALIESAAQTSSEADDLVDSSPSDYETNLRTLVKDAGLFRFWHCFRPKEQTIFLGNLIMLSGLYTARGVRLQQCAQEVIHPPSDSSSLHHKSISVL